MTIDDLVPQVVALLGNRSDAAESAPGWLQSAIIELTESYPFEELRVTGPVVALAVPAANTIATYPSTTFLNVGDLNATQVVSFSLFVDYPTNSVLRPLTYRVPQVLDSVGTYQSIPIYWTRFGDQIIIGPPPLQPYSVFMRYQRRHPFNDASIGTSQVLMPDSWFEIVAYSAALRAATQLRSDDYATRFHNILYGDPESQQGDAKRGRPGLIAARLFQIQRDQANNTRRLGIQVGRYSASR